MGGRSGKLGSSRGRISGRGGRKFVRRRRINRLKLGRLFDGRNVHYFSRPLEWVGFLERKTNSEAKEDGDEGGTQKRKKMETRRASIFASSERERI